VSNAARVFRFMTQKLLRDWGRVAVLVVLAALAIVIAVVMRVSDGGATPEDGAGFLVWYGLSIILPFGSLLVAADAFGDLRDERTLVYLWLRPVRAWSATAGTAGAALTVVVVLLVVPLIIAGLILDVPMADGALLAAVAYVGVFHRMSPEHLHRYVTEFEGRHNARDKNTADQLGEMVRGGEGRQLPYKELTGMGSRRRARAV